MDFDSLPSEPAAKTESVQATNPVTLPIATSNPAPVNFDELPSTEGQTASTSVQFDDLPKSSVGANEEKYGSIGQRIITGLEGAARGVAGPLATLAETKLLGVPEEDILGREKTNPATSGISEGVGLVGSTLLAPEIKGLTLLGGSSKIAGKALATAAEHVPEAVAFFAKHPQLAKVGSAAATAAIENTLIAGSDEVTKMILHDPDQSAATSLLHAGGIGLVLGGGFGAVSPLFKAVGESKLGKVVGDFKSRLEYLASDSSAPESVAESLQKSYDSISDVARRVYEEGGLKENEIRRFLPKGESAQKAAFGMASDYHGQGLKLIDSLVEDGAPTGVVNRVRRAVDGFETKALNASYSQDAYLAHDAINSFKQELDAASRFGKGAAPTPELSEAVNKVRELGSTLRSGLEDEAAWGKAGKVQKEINEAYSALKGKNGPMEQVRKAFMTNLNDQMVVDPSRINTYMNQLGKTTAEIKQAKMENWIKAHDDFHNVIDDVYKRNGIETPFQRESTETLAATTKGLTPGAKLADMVFKQGVGHLAGGAIGGSIGASVGAPIAGAAIGERLLGDKFAKIIPGLARKLLSKASDGAGTQASLQYAHDVVQGEKLVNRASSAVFKAGRTVIPQAFTPSEKDRKALDKKLTTVASNPQAIPDHNQTSLSHYMPEHAEAASNMTAQAVNYLNTLKPKNISQGPLDSKSIPSSSEKARYDQALNIAHSPIIVFNGIKNGSITPQNVVDLQSMYPALYSKFKLSLNQEMTSHIAKGEIIPYTTRMGLSIFMGQPLDSTMSAQSIIAAQPAPPQQPQGGGGKPPAASSTKGISKLPQQYQTPGQARESERASGK